MLFSSFLFYESSQQKFARIFFVAFGSFQLIHNSFLRVLVQSYASSFILRPHRHPPRSRSDFLCSSQLLLFFNLYSLTMARSLLPVSCSVRRFRRFLKSLFLVLSIGHRLSVFHVHLSLRSRHCLPVSPSVLVPQRLFLPLSLSLSSPSRVRRHLTLTPPSPMFVYVSLCCCLCCVDSRIGSGRSERDREEGPPVTNQGLGLRKSIKTVTSVDLP